MAINTQKFLPQGGRGGSLAVRPKTNLAPIKKQSSSLAKVGGKQEDPMLVIKTKVIKIEDLLKGTLAAEKKAADEKRKAQEKEDRAKQEQDVETPKSKEKGIKLPIPGKIKSFWGNIKKFIGTVLFGWLALQLLPLIPKLMPILKMLAATADFIINWGGKILSGLVTFVDWGYKAVEGTRKFIENKFGEDAAEKFDSFMGTINKVLNLVVALGMGAAAMGRGKKPPKGTKQPKRSVKNKLKNANKKIKRFTDPKRASKLNRVKNIKKIKADRLARVKKFGNLKKFAKAKKFVGKGIDLGKNIVKTGGELAQTAKKGITTAAKTTATAAKSAAKTTATAAKSAAKTATTAAKTATTTATKLGKTGLTTATKLGKTGLKTGLKSLKALKKIVSPIVKKIPFIGALLDFALNYFVFKEPLGRSAFMAIGAGVAAWLGGIIGSVIPVGGTLVGAALGGWAGDKLAGMLYDAIFKKKDPKDPPKSEKKKKKTTKMERNKEGYLSMLSSGKKGKIEQALYEMRINSVKTGEAHSDMVGNPKYAGDVDLIMKHGMQKVEINNGRVTLQGNANNIVSTNGVSNKASSVSSSASYEEGSDKEIVVVNTKNNSSMGSNQPTEEGKVVAVETGSGSGSGSDATASLYRG
jgi:hypothetical protein